MRLSYFHSFKPSTLATQGLIELLLLNTHVFKIFCNFKHLLKVLAEVAGICQALTARKSFVSKSSRIVTDAPAITDGY